MAAPIPDVRNKVWFYRDPQRTVFLLGLLALLGWGVVGLLRREPETYSHQHAKLAVISLGLVTGFLAAAYAPRKWGVLPNALALAFAIGGLVFVLLA